MDAIKKAFELNRAASDRPGPVKPERFTEEEMSDMLREFAQRFSLIFSGLRDSEIASRLNTTPSVIGNYVKGLRFPTAEMLVRISQVTNVNIHWLITGNGSRYLEFANLFSEEEEAEIQELAAKRGLTFEQMINRLSMSAADMIKKINF